MWKTSEGSTGRLVQLCGCYFIFYVVTGITVKYFLAPAAQGFPGMKDMEFLVYSTFGSSVVCLAILLALRWYRLQSNQSLTLGRLCFPREYLYIIPSGICTAVVIPTTTLMYMLPISVMVAMVIMRASVIVISRVVDMIQIRQGILKKKVYWEEDAAVAFALVAAGVHLCWARAKDFDFVNNIAAMTILSSYILAYAFRIYIMNYYKNTRGKGVRQDNKGFFAIEQISASVTMALVTLGILLFSKFSPGASEPVAVFSRAIIQPLPTWGWAALAGVAYGGVAFFSVFIFMFKGRTATFAGLVNRLTSLVAGTVSTLVFWLAYDPSAPPKGRDWISLGFILLAVAFLTIAEKKRTKELSTGQLESRGVLDSGGLAPTPQHV